MSLNITTDGVMRFILLLLYVISVRNLLNMYIVHVHVHVHAGWNCCCCYLNVNTKQY